MKVNHLLPSIAWEIKLVDKSYNVSFFFDLYWIYISKWSWRFSPTPFKSLIMGIPKSLRCAALPIPESWSIFGELIEPALSITSLFA